MKIGETFHRISNFNKYKPPGYKSVVAKILSRNEIEDANGQAHNIKYISGSKAPVIIDSALLKYKLANGEYTEEMITTLLDEFYSGDAKSKKELLEKNGLKAQDIYTLRAKFKYRIRKSRWAEQSLYSPEPEEVHLSEPVIIKEKKVITLEPKMKVNIRLNDNNGFDWQHSFQSLMSPSNKSQAKITPYVPSHTLLNDLQVLMRIYKEIGNGELVVDKFKEYLEKNKNKK